MTCLALPVWGRQLDPALAKMRIMVVADHAQERLSYIWTMQLPVSLPQSCSCTVVQASDVILAQTKQVDGPFAIAAVPYKSVLRKDWRS